MQKRLLALVATVAIVLSMFAGVAFAEVDRVTGLSRDGVTFNYDSETRTVTVEVEPDKIDKVNNGAGVEGRWFVAAKIAAPERARPR